MATPSESRLRVNAITKANVLAVLATRLGSYTFQYMMQCKAVKKSLLQPLPEQVDRDIFNRTILRGNRNAIYIQQKKYFTTIGFLGCGGFGTVELVKSKETGKYYALKTVQAKPKNPMARFHTVSMIERDAAITLDSDHIVRLKAAWIEINKENREPDCFKFLWENMPYGDMGELIAQFHPMVLTSKPEDEFMDSRFYVFDNRTLNEMIVGIDMMETYKNNTLDLCLLVSESSSVRRGGLQKRFAKIFLKYILQIAEGLQFMHERSIVHRDLKPQNILVDDKLNLRIGDLGLATAFDPLHLQEMHQWSNRIWRRSRKKSQATMLTGAGMPIRLLNRYRSSVAKLRLVGTRNWLAPEASGLFRVTYPGRTFRPAFHPAGDWFALGAIGFALLAGGNPITDAKVIFESQLFADIPREELHRQPMDDELQFRMKVQPWTLNPLLYPLPGVTEEDFANIFIDMRVHALCTKLMTPDPNERYDLARIKADPDYQSLMNEDETTTFQWNEFIRWKRPNKFETLVDRFEEGVPYNITGSPRQGRRIASLPGFPLMTASPGIIGSPMLSPLSKKGLGAARGVFRVSSEPEGPSTDESQQERSATAGGAAADRVAGAAAASPVAGPSGVAGAAAAAAVAGPSRAPTKFQVEVLAESSAPHLDPNAAGGPIIRSPLQLLQQQQWVQPGPAQFFQPPLPFQFETQQQYEQQYMYLQQQQQQMQNPQFPTHTAYGSQLGIYGSYGTPGAQQPTYPAFYAQPVVQGPGFLTGGLHPFPYPQQYLQTPAFPPESPHAAYGFQANIQAFAGTPHEVYGTQANIQATDYAGQAGQPSVQNPTFTSPYSSWIAPIPANQQPPWNPNENFLNYQPFNLNRQGPPPPPPGQ